MYGWSPLPRTLAAALRDATHREPRVRLSAVADLARLSGAEERERAVAALVAALESDRDQEVRARAALGLADAGGVEGLSVLLRAAESDEPRVRQLALVAVGELAEPADAEALRVVRLAWLEDAPALRFQALLAAGRLLVGQELQAWLVTAVKDDEARVRYLACRLLEQNLAEPPAPVPEALVCALECLFQDTDQEVALSAAVVLAARGSELAQARLVQALNRGGGFQPEDEQAAIDLCAQLALERALPGLRARAWGGWLRSASPFVFQARVALARLGDARARDSILKGLSSWSRPERTRSAVAAGLAGLQEARARLLVMQRDERHADGYSVAEALRALDTAPT